MRVSSYYVKGKKNSDNYKKQEVDEFTEKMTISENEEAKQLMPRN